jgi:uncharacterized protein YaaR (DUF327 family)
MELTIEKIQEYKKVKEFLDDVCEKYFETNYDTDWQLYSGWSICDNCQSVYIHYIYEEFWSNTETYTEVSEVKVKIDDLIEFSKTLCK